jgi:hypothetical protein
MVIGFGFFAADSFAVFCERSEANSIAIKHWVLDLNIDCWLLPPKKIIHHSSFTIYHFS